MEVVSGKEKYQRRVLVDCATIPLGASSLVSHQVRLFRNSKLVVQVVVIYDCYHPAYLLGKDCIDRDKLPAGVGVGYALLE